MPEVDRRISCLQSAVFNPHLLKTDTRHSSLVTGHLSLTRHSSLITRHSSLLLFLIFFSTASLSQVVYTPINSGVYPYLERMSLLGLIEYHNEAIPLSRKEIAHHLAGINDQRAELKRIDKENLDFFLAEYYNELKIGTESRWFLYDYSDSLFSFFVSPIAGYEISRFGEESGHARWWGVDIYGTASRWFGAHVNMRDRGEFGGNLDRKKSFSPLTGAPAKTVSGGTEYADVRGSVSLDWNWGSLVLAKDFFQWGHGRFGQLILSAKAPSYPHLRLELKPVDWFRFYYMHGWLNSNVLDSADFYYGRVTDEWILQRQSFVNKYIAANMFTFSPVNILDISLGNSLVYSGDFRPEMFIPFLFFKHLDTGTGKGSIDDGNGQFYIDLLLKYPRTVSFYTTLFVDVISIREIMDGDSRNFWWGLTLGGKKIDLFIDNLDLSLEYTRVNPWVYEHKDMATTYTHIDYTLGHWLGQNADQFRVQFDYSFLRGLNISAYTEFIRKGGLMDVFFAYGGNKTAEPFLYSPVRKDKIFGLEVKYEYMHDLFVKARFRYSDITDEDPSRTPSFMLGSNSSFSLSLYYGI
jgi:hypothetical protein